MDRAKRIEYGSHAKHDKEHRNIASRGQWETAARMFNMIMSGHIGKGREKNTLKTAIYTRQEPIENIRQARIVMFDNCNINIKILTTARLAQSVERKALNLVVVGSSPTVGVLSARQWAQVCSV